MKQELKRLACMMAVVVEIACCRTMAGDNSIDVWGFNNDQRIGEAAPVANATAITPYVTYADGEAGRQFVEFVQRAESSGFSGAALGAIHGKIVAAVGVGHADLARKQLNTPATLFEIASATKQFTAAAVMRLAMDGKLRLYDPIAQYLPAIPEDCRAITVEQLLRHTSGIPDTNSRGGGDDIERVLPSFLRGGPAHKPGTHWEYGNQGYAIVSEIIRRASGEEYTAYCREALFRPAGMGSTCFTGDDVPEGAVLATGLSSQGPARSALDHPYGSYGLQYRGMGGVVTNVWDLWRWDRALHGETVLGTDAKAKLFEPGLGDYALGWFVKKDKQGQLVQSHGGSVRGFCCEMRRYPAQNAFLVVLCNRDGIRLQRLAQSLEEILFGDTPSGPTALRPLDSDLVATLTGQYEGKNGRLLVINHEGVTTRAETYWSPPNGPVSRAILGLDDAGNIMLDEGSVELIAIDVEYDGNKPAESVSILGDSYQRVDTRKPTASRPARQRR